MIQLRKNPFSETQIEIPFVEGENAKQLIERTLTSNGHEASENVLEHFQILVNGVRVEKDLWEYCKIKDEDTILIGPKIARGSGGQMFKMIALIVIAIVATALTSGAAAPLAGGAWTAGAITIGGVLVLNALIPPPGLPGLGGLGGLSSSFEGSQMYTITSQQNNAKKFGGVPKVYGTHRMYPLIVANPYTEIEADPVSGTLVQYYYAIYDFGFGPLEITDIKIGDTPISDYFEAHYRLVDLNKPAVNEGPWDDALHSTFQFYKGDVERDGTTATLDKNQGSAGVQQFEYEIIRNASSKVSGNDQEISLDFVCPQGLYSMSTTGAKYKENIELKVEFSKIGENIWKPYNDLSFVYDSHLAGGDSVFLSKVGTVAPINLDGSGGDYSLLGTTKNFYWSFSNEGPREVNGVSTRTYHDHDGDNNTPEIKMVHSLIKKYGWPAGTTKITLETISVSIANGDALYFQGTLLGAVVSTNASAIPGYTEYVLAAPIPVTKTVFQVREYYVRSATRTYDVWGKGTGVIYSEPYLYERVFITSSSLVDKVYVKYKSLGAARMSANTENPFYSTIKFKPKEISQFKVRITRITSFGAGSYTRVNKLSLINLSTRFDREPILTNKRHVFLEVRVRATNQLNGSINNLSAIAESVLDVYDPDTATWSKQKTDNPAWIFCDLLTGQINKRALDKSRLHLPSIVEWADFCDEIPTPPLFQIYTTKRFSCNFVLDFDATLQSMLNTVGNAAQASLNIVDGKYGVLIDKLKTVPVQVFTPRNSSGFSSTRNYDQTPHGLKIRYLDPAKDWEVAELIVYDNGYDENNAEDFDELSTFGCTNHEQAWRFGRYMLAQARLRKEKIVINVDFEYLVCTRGDYVQITQDVMRVGGRPARVKEITGVDTVKIDDAIDTLVNVDYGYVYRGADGIKTSSCDVLDSDEFKLYGDMPAVGDLIIIGEVGKVVFDCIVKTISPSSELTATLELVEKADDVYLAESSNSLPDYDPQITLNVDSNDAIPPEIEDFVVTENSWRVVGGAYEYYIDLDWELPTGAAFETYEVYVDSGSGYDLVDYTKNSFYEYIVDAPNDLDILHKFKVLAVSSTGKKIPLFDAPEVTATPLKKLTRPSDVADIFINITNEVLQLDWTPVTDPDLDEYLIRYSPLTVGATWEASVPFLRADKNSTMAAFQGRTGTYFIKAVDLNGNQSFSPAQARTTIPNLFNLNVIQETNDFPALDGEMVTTEEVTGALTIKRQVVGMVETNQYYNEGYYYYKELLDLGEIYTVRLQSLILAEGFTVGDQMSNWNPLSDVLAMSNAGTADWDVETWYRATDALNVIGDWDTMSEVDPISNGDPDDWTPWVKFTMGDFTARIFQFRLKLVSNNVSVTPRVFDGVIRADMPDRVESYNNLFSTVLGYQLSYVPSFAGPDNSPNVQITQDDAEQGDYYIIENKTLNGCKITFYDKNNVAVIRQFDVAVKGYGRSALAVI